MSEPRHDIDCEALNDAEALRMDIAALDSTWPVLHGSGSMTTTISIHMLGRLYHAAKGAALPVPALDALLGTLADDDVMYDYPVAMTGEPMDPVLYVRWDAIRAALGSQEDVK